MTLPNTPALHRASALARLQQGMAVLSLLGAGLWWRWWWHDTPVLAVLGAAALGRTRAEVEAARDALRAMLKDGAAPPAPPFDGFEVLIPAREYKNRHASILLSLEATCEAMAAADPAAAQEG